MIYGDNTNEVKQQGFYLLRDSVQARYQSRFSARFSTAVGDDDDMMYRLCFLYDNTVILRIPVVEFLDSDNCFERGFRDIKFSKKDQVIGAVVESLLIWLGKFRHVMPACDSASNLTEWEYDWHTLSHDMQSLKRKHNHNQIKRQRLMASPVWTCCSKTLASVDISDEQLSEAVVEMVSHVFGYLSQYMQEICHNMTLETQSEKENYQDLLHKLLRMMIFMRKIVNDRSDSNEQCNYLEKILLNVIEAFYLRLEGIFPPVDIKPKESFFWHVSLYEESIMKLHSQIGFYEKNHRPGKPILVSIERVHDYTRDYGIYYASRICFWQEGRRLGTACYIPSWFDFLARYYLAGKNYRLKQTNKNKYIGNYQVFYLAEGVSRNAFSADVGCFFGSDHNGWVFGM